MKNDFSLLCHEKRPRFEFQVVTSGEFGWVRITIVINNLFLSCFFVFPLEENK